MSGAGTNASGVRRRAPLPLRWSAPWWALPVGVLALSRIVQTVLLLVAARDQLPPDQAQTFYVPLVSGDSYLDLVANWDGQWYAEIARNGYPDTFDAPVDGPRQSPWAFYPLYPALAGLLMRAGLSFGVAASVVSLTATLLAVLLLDRLLVPRVGRFTATLGVAALCFFPASLVLQTGYAESLALLLVLAGLWTLREERYALLALAGIALSFTRPIAPALVSVALVHGVARWRARDQRPFSPRTAATYAASVASITVSCLAWPLTTGFVIGDPGAYRTLQESFIEGRPGAESGSWLARAVTLAPPGLTVLVALFVVLLLVIVLRRPARRWGLELGAWAIVYPLFVLTVTPPISSIVRHLMLAVVPWWPVPDADEWVRSPVARITLLGAVVVGGSVLSSLWISTCFVPSAPDSQWP